MSKLPLKKYDTFMKLQLQPIVVGGREGTGSGTIMQVSSPGFTPS